MGLTNSQILDRIQAGLGNRTDKTRAGDLIPWANLAQMRITRAHYWDELDRNQPIQVTPSGVPATDKIYTNTTAIRDIQSVRFHEDAYPNQARKLTYIPVRDWDKIIPSGEELSTGTPTHYTYYADNIEFYRVPDQAWTMQIRWTLWPAEITDDSSYPDLQEKDDLIIYLALSYGFHELNMTEEGNRNYAIYRTMLKDAIAEDVSNRDSNIIPLQIRSNDAPAQDPWTDPFVRS